MQSKSSSLNFCLDLLTSSFSLSLSLLSLALSELTDKQKIMLQGESHVHPFTIVVALCIVAFLLKIANYRESEYTALLILLKYSCVSPLFAISSFSRVCLCGLNLKVWRYCIYVFFSRRNKKSIRNISSIVG